jgi:hypothetical protein
VSGEAEKPPHLQLLLLLSLRVLLVVIPEGDLHLRLRDKLPRMGRLLQSRTPAQLLCIIASSNALVVIGFGVLSLPSWRHRGLSLSFWLLAAIILGLIGSLVTEQALRDGINSERWADRLLETPRSLTGSTAFSILCGLIFLIYLAYVIFPAAHNVGGSLMLFWPLMSLLRVGTYLRPKPPSDRLFQSREQPKPLQSENWGTPPRPSSN